MLLPSVKETDRLTDADRCLRVAVSVFVTIFAAAMNFALYVSGYYSPYLIIIMFMGPFLSFTACKEYKGKIKMKPRDANMFCPSCGERGAMERYDENVGSETNREYRVVYVKRTTTVYWASMIHCRSCGYKSNQNREGAPAAGAVGGGRVARGRANLENDPVAKARAILAASKAKQGNNTSLAQGRIVYAKVETDETANDSDMPLATAVESTLELPPGGESASKHSTSAASDVMVV